jgi:hypothetical protein
MRVPDATWVAVLTLLILQTSFLLPPFGYAVLMVRQSRLLNSRRLTVALLPFLAAQLTVLFLVIGFPTIVYRDTPVQPPSPAGAAPPESPGDLQKLLQSQPDDEGGERPGSK